MKRYIFIDIPMVLICLSLLSGCWRSEQKQDTAKAESYDSTKVHSHAIDEVSALIQKDSLNAGLYFKRAQLYQGLGDLKSALTDMYLAGVLDPKNNDYNLYAADLFIQDKEPKRAIALLDHAISLDSGNVKYYVYGGKFAYMIKDYPGALAHFNEGIRIDIFNPDLYYWRGMTYLDMGDTTRALSALQTCVEQDPKNSEAYLEIGLLLRQRQDKMADKYLDNAVKANPKATDALYAKGFAQQEQGKYQESIETFKTIIERDYKNEEALYALGVSYMQVDSIPAAYKYFGMAIQMNPKYAEAYYKKGRCAEEMKHLQEAKSLYQDCLNFKPDYKLAQEGLKRLGGS
ncbi:MAG: tetratricopeptide repeat protein [Bacteroidetes bacterium]|nr:tetratricopeptide repeat protein [Bacteroidota bacterium]